MARASLLFGLVAGGLNVLSMLMALMWPISDVYKTSRIMTTGDEIRGLIAGFPWLVSLIPGIVAIVLGVIALRRRRGDNQASRSAKVGIILGLSPGLTILVTMLQELYLRLRYPL